MGLSVVEGSLYDGKHLVACLLNAKRLSNCTATKMKRLFRNYKLMLNTMEVFANNGLSNDNCDSAELAGRRVRGMAFDVLEQIHAPESVEIQIRAKDRTWVHLCDYIGDAKGLKRELKSWRAAAWAQKTIVRIKP